MRYNRCDICTKSLPYTNCQVLALDMCQECLRLAKPKMERIVEVQEAAIAALSEEIRKILYARRGHTEATK